MIAQLQRLLHKLEEYAGGLEFAQELKTAKQKFFNPVGTPGKNGAREDTEVELANFIEWFVFDWKLPDGQNLWAKFLRFKAAGYDASDLEILKQMNHQQYSLFLVKKNSPGKACVADLVSKKKYRPVQGLSPSLQAGDLFLGRLLTINGQYFFTEAFFFAPRPLGELYERRAKLVRKGKMDREQFLEELRNSVIKAIRYPRMKLEEIYR